MTFLLWGAAVVLVGVGLAGIVFPALPGTVLIFAGLLLAAWIDGFTRVGVPTLVVIGILAASSYFVDVVGAGLGAQRLGASRRAIIGAGLGTLLGLPLGIVGVLLGPLVGAIVGELTVHRDWKRAGQVGLAAWLGFLVGTVVKIALAFTMVALFVLSAFLW